MEPRSKRRNRNNAANPREVYIAEDGFMARRRLEEAAEKCAKARERNMRRRMKPEREDGGRLFSALRRLCQRYYTADSQGERALARSRRGGETRPRRIDCRSAFLKYGYVGIVEAK